MKQVEAAKLTHDPSFYKPEVDVAQNHPPHAEYAHSIERSDSTRRYSTVHHFTGVAND